MLLTGKESLEERIVLLLSAQSRLAAQAIFSAVNKGPASYTLQAVYKELRKLQQQGVVGKLGRGYSLRLSWVLGLDELGERMVNTYLKSGALSTLLKTKSKQTWYVSNLIRLNDLWDQLLISLVQESTSKQLFGYTKHAWYHLAQPQAEDQYIRAVSKEGGKIYLALGSKLPLDAWAEQFWPKHIMEFGYTRQPLHDDHTVEFDVIDDYIVTTKKDLKITQALESIYAQAKTPADVRGDVLLSVFTRPTRVRVTLEHNPTKAARLRKKFFQFFGTKPKH
jgi:hypothetical protein